MSASLFLSGVSASFGARPLFSGLQLRLTPGDVTALVGTIDLVLGDTDR